MAAKVPSKPAGLQLEDFDWSDGAHADPCEECDARHALIGNAKVLRTCPVLVDAHRAADERCEPGTCRVWGLALANVPSRLFASSRWGHLLGFIVRRLRDASQMCQIRLTLNLGNV